MTPLGASAWSCADGVGEGGALTRAREHPAEGGLRTRAHSHPRTAVQHTTTLCQIVLRQQLLAANAAVVEARAVATA